MNRPAAAARSSDAAVNAELSLPGFALLFSTSLLPGVTRLDARPGVSPGSVESRYRKPRRL